MRACYRYVLQRLFLGTSSRTGSSSCWSPTGPKGTHVETMYTLTAPTHVCLPLQQRRTVYGLTYSTMSHQ